MIGKNAVRIKHRRAGCSCAKVMDGRGSQTAAVEIRSEVNICVPGAVMYQSVSKTKILCLFHFIGKLETLCSEDFTVESNE